MDDVGDPEIVRAPPTHVVVMILGAAAIIGVLILLTMKIRFFPWLQHYLESGPSRAEALRRFKFVMLGAGIPPLVSAIYMAWLGIRVLRQDRWPLANSLVWRDTLVMRGHRAHARGLLLIVLAILLAACAIGLAVIPYSLPR